MKTTTKKNPLRHVLSVSGMFTHSRLDVILMAPNPDDERNAFFKVNPNKQFSPQPVIDDITMGIVSRIFHIMNKNGELNDLIVFAAGHYTNYTPHYFTSTVGPLCTVPTERILKMISRDVTNNHSTPDIFAYIRRVQRKTRTEVELIKRVFNGWVIANMVLDEARTEPSLCDKRDTMDFIHKTPEGLFV